MAKSISERLGGGYEQQGDYLIPRLIVSTEEKQAIGIWGQRHLDYLKQYRKITYTNLLTSGKLNAYLADINEQAQECSHRLIEDMKQAPPMPSDTPTELVAIVWIYAKMEEPEKVQILDFIRENVKPGTNEGEKEKLMELMEKSKLNLSPYVEEFHSLMQELIGTFIAQACVNMINLP